MKSLRPYQSRILSDLERIYAGQDAGYQRAGLQMPTGTGKTITAAAFALSQVPKGKVIWVAHQTLLIEQAKTSVRDFFDGRGSGSVVKVGETEFHFRSWQAFRDADNKDDFDLVICDEFHCGGSQAIGDAEKKSFSKIFAPGIIGKHLMVSATPWEVDATLFGDLPVAEYNWRDASLDGNINDVTFQRYEAVLGVAVSDGTTREGGTTADLVALLNADSVSFTHREAQQKLDTVVVTCLMEAYKKEECAGTPAIVFCRSVGDENDMLSLVNVERLIQAAIPGARTACLHGELDAKAKSAISAAFKEDRITFLLVCQMANEGFDYPELEVAIDFNFKLNNEKRTIQKIGRIIRAPPCKPASRYYYASSIKIARTIDGKAKEWDEATLAAVTSKIRAENPTASDLAVRAGAEALMDVVQVTERGGVGSIPHGTPVLTEAVVSQPASQNVPEGPLKEVLKQLASDQGMASFRSIGSSTGLIVRAVLKSGTETSHSFTLSDALQTPAGGHDKDANLVEFYRAHDAGEAKPPRNSKLGQALNNYMTKGSGSFVPGLRERLHRWFPAEVSRPDKDGKLVEFYRSHDAAEVKPHWKSARGKALRNYTHKSSKAFVPGLRESLHRWFPAGARRHAKAPKLTEMYRAHDAGEARPHWKSAQGKALYNYTAKSSKAFVPGLRESLHRWFTKG